MVNLTLRLALFDVKSDLNEKLKDPILPLKVALRRSQLPLIELLALHVEQEIKDRVSYPKVADSEAKARDVGERCY